MASLSFSLKQLAEHLSAELIGDPECEIIRVASLEKAKKGHISFLHNPRYRDFLNTTHASAVIISPKDIPFYSGNSLVMENPYLGYAKVAHLFIKKGDIKPGIHPTAIIGQHCQIAVTASIGAHCVIGDGVSIGDHTIIRSNCTIGDDCQLGAHVLIYPGVMIYHGISLGNRVIIHSGAVVGADGFGMVNDNGYGLKYPNWAVYS